MFNKREIEGFLNTVESLKKYRRADLIDEEGKNILDMLYTDLLPEDYILKKCLLDNTTYLIGRKGTGKSTIFLKMEKEIRKNKSYLSSYIDVKTIYESSQAQRIDYDYLEEFLSSDILERYLLERTFIQNILNSINDEICKRYNSIYQRTLGRFINSKPNEVKVKIDNLYNKINNNEYIKNIEIPTIRKSSINSKQSYEHENSIKKKFCGGESKLNISTDSIMLSSKDGTGYNSSRIDKDKSLIEGNFSEIFLRVFEIKEIIKEIKEILNLLDIKHLVVMLDDLSEIDDSAIVTFVDTIIAPLNNWSEEFIKFKIAAYPNRIHFGKIDPSKVDTINLDFYNLYSEFDRNKMEEYAVDFTRRLLEKRIRYFTNNDMDNYFDTSKGTTLDEYYELIFQVSMNVPRIIGYILSYCHQNKIIFHKKINRQDIESAAEKYYNEKISSFFKTNIYTLKSLDERISTYQLNELNNVIVDKLVDIKKRIVSGDLKGSLYLKKSPYSSHFYIEPSLEKYLKTLELNHFISKYNEMSDRDGNLAYVYCINYGLAKKNNILWGKPNGSEYRKYFIERPFGFSKFVKEFIFNSKKIQCSNINCNKVFKKEEIPFLEFTNYKCNSCGSEVKVETLANSFVEDVNKIKEELLLAEKDIKIIVELSNYGNEYKYAREIAEELDYSINIVASRCKILSSAHDLIERKKIRDNEPYMYRITEKARAIYKL